MGEHPDQKLIHRCLKHDRKAQQQLFNRFAPKMMFLCARYARHSMEAEDILQEGFIRVFTYLKDFKFKGSLEGWIRRIMVHTALRHIDKSLLNMEPLGIAEHLEEVSGTDVLAKLSEQELLAIIHELPIGYRTVFNLYVVEGFSHQEIGNLLGIQVGTSRSQLLKARKILQSRIKNNHKVAV